MDSDVVSLCLLSISSSVAWRSTRGIPTGSVQFISQPFIIESRSWASDSLRQGHTERGRGLQQRYRGLHSSGVRALSLLLVQCSISTARRRRVRRVDKYYGEHRPVDDSCRGQSGRVGRQPRQQYNYPARQPGRCCFHRTLRWNYPICRLST